MAWDRYWRGRNPSGPERRAQMSIFGILLLVLMVLAIAALVKFLRGG